MAPEGRPGIRPVAYRPAKHGAGVEAFTVASIRRRVSNEELRSPQRVDFHVVLICTRGRGKHEVDFDAVSLVPRRLVHVRPTQVQRWCFDEAYQGTVIVFPHTTALRSASWARGPRAYDLSAAELRHTQAILQLLQRENQIARPPQDRERALNSFASCCCWP